MTELTTLPRRPRDSRIPRDKPGLRLPLTPTTPLGARLRQLRERAGLNQQAMAQRIGYPAAGSGRVSDWELGYHVPTLDNLARYARVFDMTVAQLLEGVL